MEDVTALSIAVEADAPRLVALINRAFAVERFFVDRDRITLAQVAGYLTSGTFLIVDGAGELAACVYLEPHGDRAYIGMLAVQPGQQGRGLGGRMMDAAERRAASLGCRAVDIRVVNLREELPPFYRARGYVEHGQAPFEDPLATKPAHFILMAKELVP
jgi:ribosomal protein S18 acetylase RimI-like enzyme